MIPPSRSKHCNRFSLTFVSPSDFSIVEILLYVQSFKPSICLTRCPPHSEGAGEIQSLSYLRTCIWAIESAGKCLPSSPFVQFRPFLFTSLQLGILLFTTQIILNWESCLEFINSSYVWFLTFVICEWIINFYKWNF